MLPNAYELPAAIVLVLAGAITCFAGYRLFRFVLAIWGFILGAGIGSSMMGGDNAVAMLVAGLVGGVLGALISHVAWSQLAPPGDPPAAVIIIASILGAIAAMVLERYVIVVGTAFGGAWLAVVGAAALAASLPNRDALASEVWILYPLTPAPGQRWVLAAWVGVGLMGIAAQLVFGGKKGGKGK